MMQVMKDIGGIELPEALIKFTEDGPAALVDSTSSEEDDSVVVADSGDQDGAPDLV